MDDKNKIYTINSDNEARQKLADALVNGKTLFIEGGDVDLCQREEAGCGRKCGQICRNKAAHEAKVQPDNLSLLIKLTARQP